LDIIFAIRDYGNLGPYTLVTYFQLHFNCSLTLSMWCYCLICSDENSMRTLQYLMASGHKASRKVVSAKGTAADFGILPGLWIQSEEPSDKQEMFCVRARVIFGTLALDGPRRPLPPPLPRFRVSPSPDLPTELPASTAPAILTTR